MDLERIESLLKMLAEHDVNEFTYRDGEKTIRLKLGPVVGPMTMSMHPAPVAHVAHAAPPAGAHAPATPAAAPAKDDGLFVVESPMVGTLYRAPSPGAPTFVEVGSTVQKGKTLCIVEAMKLMNEIECDADGVVAEIYPKNAQPVEYGEALFGLRAD